jgi:ketosteroid isomerase-like protein
MITESGMKGKDVRLTIWLAMVVLCSAAMAANCPEKQAKSGAALVAIEHTWAKALEQKDADAVGCILADEFQDAGVYGELHSREETLAHISERGPGSNVLSEMQPHIFGDAGYVRGLNTVTDTQGKAVAKVRFTDIFVYREGRWKAVAGQETLVTEKSGQ